MEEERRRSNNVRVENRLLSVETKKFKSNETICVSIEREDGEFWCTRREEEKWEMKPKRRIPVFLYRMRRKKKAVEP